MNGEKFIVTSFLVLHTVIYIEAQLSRLGQVTNLTQSSDAQGHEQLVGPASMYPVFCGPTNATLDGISCEFYGKIQDAQKYNASQQE